MEQLELIALDNPALPSLTLTSSRSGSLSPPPAPIPITIGTLAFERHCDGMAKSGRKRARMIVGVALTHKPDLLFCAGYAMRRTKHLKWLAYCHAQSQTHTHLLVEVERDEHLLALLKTKAKRRISPMKHRNSPHRSKGQYTSAWTSDHNASSGLHIGRDQTE
jgi:hypothetical protein